MWMITFWMSAVWMIPVVNDSHVDNFLVYYSLLDDCHVDDSLVDNCLCFFPLPLV